MTQAMCQKGGTALQMPECVKAKDIVPACAISESLARELHRGVNALQRRTLPRHEVECGLAFRKAGKSCTVVGPQAS